MPPRTRRLALLLLALPAIATLASGCGAGATADDTPPGDDQPPAATALARCADPARPIASAWEVDNIRAPLLAQAQDGATILVTSADGAVKTWELPAAGGAPSAPHYGTPFVDEGAQVPAIGAGATAFAGLAVDGRAHVWGRDGAVLNDPIQLVGAPGAFVAIDDDARWLVGGTADFAGALAVADLATGAVTGPLETELWHATDAAIGPSGTVVIVGDWYGCPALEVRDADDPAVVVAYWDACHWDGPAASGWFRSVALNPAGTEAIAVGDGIYARFELATAAAGPREHVLDDQRRDAVVWSAADHLAITLGPAGELDSTIAIWDTVDPHVTRTTTVPAAIGLTVDAAAGVLVTARADGMVRGDRCSE